MCWDPEQGECKAQTEIERDANASKVLIQSGSECIYFTAGTMLGKIEVPSMTPVYKVETSHKAGIIDMVVTSYNQIITTSEDTDIRFFSMYDGRKVGQPLQEMECDHLAAHGLHLVTRIGQGEAMLVWKILASGGVEENPVGEVELTPAD